MIGIPPISTLCVEEFTFKSKVGRDDSVYMLPP
jgi:hypothetical protein